MTRGSRRGRRLRYGASACSAFGIVLASACYTTGNGTAPPANEFYYPVGLAVSAAGNVLYAVNSDFDLQFNGGTLQSYDLTSIRNDTVALILAIYQGAPPFDAGIPLEAGTDAGILDAGPLPFEAGVVAATAAACPNTINNPASTNPNDPNGWNNQPGRLPLGQACAPPMDSTHYYRDSVTIGAFATDLQLGLNQERLFSPVRGDATLTWIDVQNDSFPQYIAGANPNDTNPLHYIPFSLSGSPSCNANPLLGSPAETCGCNADPVTNRCDSAHHAGQLGDYDNTRQVTMPGEPFAMAFTDDGMAIALTHQAENDTSLFLSGFLPASLPSVSVAPAASDDAGSATDAATGDDAGTDAGSAADAGTAVDAGTDAGVAEIASSANLGVNSFPATIQFIVTDLPLGGDGIVSIPHDPAAIVNPDPANPLRPAFLQTSNQQAEIDLLRYYSDEGYQQNLTPDGGGPNLVDAGVAIRVGSSNLRPFLLKERVYSVTVNANGSNSRGIAIDPTPRIACEWNVTQSGLPTTSPEYVACAQTPARVFIASRTPASLILGQVGGMSEEGTTYDPDQLTIYGNVPLSAGPSNVYVAPIVDKNGQYAVRVFIVCFDSQTIAIYDPDAGRIENVVSTGPGPFAMAFDPFDIAAVAIHATVPPDPRSKYMNIQDGKVVGPALKAYRFAYITSFTDSFVQIMDLDQSFRDDRLGPGGSTFENLVYNLGLPIPPVGAN